MDVKRFAVLKWPQAFGVNYLFLYRYNNPLIARKRG